MVKVAMRVAVLAMLGLAWFQAPALAQEDPSGIYEGETVTEGVPAQFTPPAEVRCTGSTCTVSWGSFETGVEVASEGTTTVEIDRGPSACGPPLPPMTVVVTLGGGSMTITWSTPDAEIAGPGCVQPVFGQSSTFTGTKTDDGAGDETGSSSPDPADASANSAGDPPSEGGTGDGAPSAPVIAGAAVGVAGLGAAAALLVRHRRRKPADPSPIGVPQGPRTRPVPDPGTQQIEVTGPVLTVSVRGMAGPPSPPTLDLVRANDPPPNDRGTDVT